MPPHPSLLNLRPQGISMTLFKTTLFAVLTAVTLGAWAQ
jgi:hypothetical protein